MDPKWKVPKAHDNENPWSNFDLYGTINHEKETTRFANRLFRVGTIGDTLKSPTQLH